MSWISDRPTVNISNLYELAEAIPIEGGEPSQKLKLYAPLGEEFVPSTYLVAHNSL